MHNLQDPRWFNQVLLPSGWLQEPQYQSLNQTQEFRRWKPVHDGELVARHRLFSSAINIKALVDVGEHQPSESELMHMISPVVRVAVGKTAARFVGVKGESVLHNEHMEPTRAQKAPYPEASSQPFGSFSASLEFEHS